MNDFAKTVCVQAALWMVVVFLVASCAKAQQLAYPEANKLPTLTVQEERVVQGYQNYMLVRRCYELREGYSMQFVSVFELERATDAIKYIVFKNQFESNGTIDTDELWRQATGRSVGFAISNSWCHVYYEKLLLQSPYTVYSTEKPF
jgi:hypothetical protein